MHYPMNEVYRWSPAEGIIGVMGVAPTATADFYQRITALTPARKDWEHVRVLIDSNPKLPSRGRHLELGETDPSPFIRAGIDALIARGATVVAVPCNTAHVLYSRYAAGAEQQIPNMIDAAVAQLVARCEGAPRQLAVLGSRHTVAYDLYGKRLQPLNGGCCSIPAPLQTEVSSIIEAVKQGCDLAAAALRVQAVMLTLVEADAFVIACTELSAVARQEWVDVPLIDASDALARVCLERVKPATSRLFGASSVTAVSFA